MKEQQPAAQNKSLSLEKGADLDLDKALWVFTLQVAADWGCPVSLYHTDLARGSEPLPIFSVYSHNSALSPILQMGNRGTRGLSDFPGPTHGGQAGIESRSSPTAHASAPTIGRTFLKTP